MDFEEPIDGLELDDELVADEKVDLRLPDLAALVEHRESYLRSKGNPAQCKLDRECTLIRGLQEARAENSMNLQCGADDGVCEIVEVRRRFETRCGHDLVPSTTPHGGC